MTPADIRKIYSDRDLIAEYKKLETEIRALDVGIPIPPPVHIAALDEMRRILSGLQGET